MIENKALREDISSECFDIDPKEEGKDKKIVEQLEKLANDRETFVKDGCWYIRAPFALGANIGLFSRNEYLVILLGVFGMVDKKEGDGEQQQNAGSGDGNQSKGLSSDQGSLVENQKKSGDGNGSGSKIGSSSPSSSGGGGVGGESFDKKEGSGWMDGRSKPDALNELVWMEISIPSIGRQLRVQYPLSATIGQIKNYLKSQFAEEMKNLPNLYAYELCHLQSVTSGGEDVWLLYPESNLYSYNIQNNDVLEFSVDEDQMESRKPVELEGYLQKEGQRGLKLWKTRWFSTQDNRLLYSPSETSNDPVGFIPLTQVSSIAPLTHPSQPHNKTIFEVKTEQRSYHLMAECDDDRDIWVSGLSNSVAFWKANSTQWKEGFLVKRGGIRHNWLKRWFMLRDEFLFYYEAKDGSHYLRGKIPLYGVAVEPVERKKTTSQSHFYFNLSTAGRVFQLAAYTEQERQSWVAALNSQVRVVSSRIDNITAT
mmetsp:Transcript_12296/g.16427  ORF Transcript_12296/g.16427 Transcript_12296/m.16427 type:complete len:482 (+) Transcript_12296:1040-2485(+)